MRIKVNGTEYEIPAGETLKMGEWQTVERYCEGHVDDDGYSISKVMGFIHVAIKRAEPTVPDDQIRAVVEDLTLADMPDANLVGQNPPADGTLPPPDTLEGSGPNGTERSPDSKTLKPSGTTS